MQNVLYVERNTLGWGLLYGNDKYECGADLVIINENNRTQFTNSQDTESAEE